MAKHKRRSTKGAILKGMLEKIPSGTFHTFRKELKEVLGNNSGIYALYKGDKLYYVGLAKSLYWRTFTHLERDRLRGKWDSFSIFIVRNIRYLRDLETLVVRISKPKANRVEGRLPQHNFLREKLKKIAKEKKEEAGDIEEALR